MGDPNCKDQKVFEPSSDWMPPFMRVNPVLDWTYGHIWHFLRFFDLPYCSLYDKGFTSLGNNDNTFPCPALKKHNAEGYWPAYMLTDWSRERDGRVKKEKDELMPPPPASPPQPLIGQPCSVGLLIIGDEILNGMVHDVNTFAAATSLKSVSVPLERVLIVGDDEDEIVDSIIRLSQHGECLRSRCSFFRCQRFGVVSDAINTVRATRYARCSRLHRDIGGRGTDARRCHDEGCVSLSLFAPRCQHGDG